MAVNNFRNKKTTRNTFADDVAEEVCDGHCRNTWERPAHIHARALRYMIKEFLRELHIVWRHLEGLPIYEAYEAGKLGYEHRRNDFIFKRFGIDSTKFKPLIDLSPEEAKPKSIYPAAVQAYNDARSRPKMVIEMAV